MGISAVKYKIMPSGLDVDLEYLKKESEKIIVENGGRVSEYEEEPIAFGLKALIVFFAFPEEKDVEEVGNYLLEIDGVSSAQMIDYRRAIG